MTGRAGSDGRVGRAWCFGDDVDTDVMAPWEGITEPFERRRHRVLHPRPEFAAEVRPGDVVVAGRNWGCGSSREQAPENLKLLGVAVVLAESFGRIYFRNAVAIAFPNLVCPGITGAVREGDELTVDVRAATVHSRRTGAVLRGEPYTPEMLAIIEAGGLLEVLRARFGGASTPVSPPGSG